MLTRARQKDQDIQKQILAQLATLAAAQKAPVDPKNPVRTIEQQAPVDTREGVPKYSKKQPDPKPLSDGIDPTFESWRLQIQGKFRVNADHYENEEAKMLYLFNRTEGDAQKHLHPRYKDDSPIRFVSA